MLTLMWPVLDESSKHRYTGLCPLAQNDRGWDVGRGLDGRSERRTKARLPGDLRKMADRHALVDLDDHVTSGTAGLDEQAANQLRPALEPVRSRWMGAAGLRLACNHERRARIATTKSSPRSFHTASGPVAIGIQDALSRRTPPAWCARDVNDEPFGMDDDVGLGIGFCLGAALQLPCPQP